MFAFIRRLRDAWKCPACGTVNPKSAGTASICSCGVYHRN